MAIDRPCVLPDLGEQFPVVPRNVRVELIREPFNKRFVHTPVLSFELKEISRELYTAIESLKGASIKARFGSNPAGMEINIEGHPPFTNAVFRKVTQTKTINVEGVERIDCKVEYHSLNREYC
jgi:hypothetical protein